MKTLSRLLYILLPAIFLILPTCTANPQSQKMVTVQRGGLMDEIVTFQYALYLKASPAPRLAEVLEFLAGKYPTLGLTPEKKDRPPFSIVRIEKNVQQNYAPPEGSFLKHFARGFGQADIMALAATTCAIIITFQVDNDSAFTNLTTANQCLYDLAKRWDSYLWDEESRTVSTPAYWKKHMLTTKENGVFSIQDHMVIHQYQDGDHLRSITVGMKKFGLPDIVVNQSVRGTGKSVGNLINIVCQFLSENPDLEIKGSLELDLDKLRQTSFRENQKADLINDGTGQGVILLEKSPLEEGDADNRLWGIKFEDYSDQDITIKQEVFFSRFFGSEDKVVHVRHTDELLAASERAKQKLPTLQKLFNAGLPPGDILYLKAPFTTTQGGNEWMWIEIVSWKTSHINGILASDPEQVPSLKAGQKVIINQEQVFDYILQHENGTTEGNETGAILEKMQKNP